MPIHCLVDSWKLKEETQRGWRRGAGIVALRGLSRWQPHQNAGHAGLQVSFQ
jgi:hypothetical protein